MSTFSTQNMFYFCSKQHSPQVLFANKDCTQVFLQHSFWFVFGMLPFAEMHKKPQDVWSFCGRKFLTCLASVFSVSTCEVSVYWTTLRRIQREQWWGGGEGQYWSESFRVVLHLRVVAGRDWAKMADFAQFAPISNPGAKWRHFAGGQPQSLKHTLGGWNQRNSRVLWVWGQD